LQRITLAVRRKQRRVDHRLIIELVHPLLNRPLIIEALPTLLQAQFANHFQSNDIPINHPYPNNIQSLFDNITQFDYEPFAEDVLEEGNLLDDMNVILFFILESGF
jgi:hypothetical protein